MRGKLLLAALVVSLAICGLASAATTATVSITVTIQSLGVSVDTPTWAIGTIAAGADAQNNPAVVITNTGNVAEDFSLARTKAAAWTVGTTITGNIAETDVLAARLVASQPAVGVYVNGDVILTSTTFADGATKFGNGGFNIAASGTQNMWMLFRAPSSTTATTQQTITLTVGCQKH